VAKSVFYSFHYERDVHRVQLVRNINALEGQPILNAQDWEEVRRKSDAGIEDWIHRQMIYTKAVIVLIGAKTASRPWVLYEIEKAWRDKRPLLGVRIHGLSSFGQSDVPGLNPFDMVKGTSNVPVFDPTRKDWQGRIDTKATYSNLADNLEHWSGRGLVRST
jgi:hypothetical protein